jgi:hypothetical protein
MHSFFFGHTHAFFLFLQDMGMHSGTYAYALLLICFFSLVRAGRIREAVSSGSQVRSFSFFSNLFSNLQPINKTSIRFINFLALLHILHVSSL